MATIELYNGNCLTELQKIADNSIDSVVTDPPYELGFMGKAWDASGIAFNVNVWKECLRVLKPGGHILAFGGTRTYHRMTVAIEDAGFEIRDCIAWMYGSGFPKSHNIALAIDKAEGVTGHRGKAINIKGAGDRKDIQGIEKQAQNSEFYHKPYNEPISDNAKEWNGWGTALKPAFEPVVMGRKPLEGTVANNVLTHGVGGLNIDESRVGDEVRTTPIHSDDVKEDNTLFGLHPTIQHHREETTLGRWPANIIFDNNTDTEWKRFFYCPKPNKKDKGDDNKHPTVKPTELMKYLIRLVTPKDGIVLDPFMGSGSTGKAAMQEGMWFVGIEREKEYYEIAKQRIEYEADKRKFW